jgi:hypothetical protein
MKSESNKLRPTSTAGSVYELLTGHEYTRAAQCFSRIDPASITDARCPAPSCLRVGKLQLFEKFGGVGQAGSLAEARRMLEEEQEIDVAVLDLGLPDGYGADLIKALREKNPQAQALVLSAPLDRANMARAVERGAAGVLNKMAHL